MPIPNDTSLESVNKELCISFFEELFSMEELKEKISQFSPENLVTTSKKRTQTNRKSFFETLGIEQIQDKTKLAEIFYEMLGPHFLYEIHGVGPNNDHSRNLRYEIFKKTIELGWINLNTISKVVGKLPKRNDKGIKNLTDILPLKIPGPWQFEMLNLIPSKFNLPSEVVEAPSTSQKKKDNIEIITAIRELHPLHDYQLFAGKKIKDLLGESKNIRKRLLISISTGAGKTRLVAESLIDWMNDGKPSIDSKIHNSKYMIWIAQSRELCEQAISQFQEIYSQKGKSALTIFRFFGDRNITLDTILAQRVEHGLIVCTIDKIYKHIKDIRNLSDFKQSFHQNAIELDDKIQKSKFPQKFYDDRTFGRLRKMTSCVVIDEAHKAIMPTYTCVLRGLGFNFSYKDEEKCNEFGITLIGLTATAFRGTGLERSKDVTIEESTQDKVKISFYEHGVKKYDEITFPLNCTECKKPIISGDKVLQSSTNKKLFWHSDEQRLSAETTRIYTRFSEPLIPKIQAFQENKQPKAIITCNEKSVANDPIRISGEKSYDLLGNIVKYSWKIEKRPSLTEVFNIEQSEKIDLPQPKSLPVIIEEIKYPGHYKISLTVENYDGYKDTTTKTIEVIHLKESETSDEMKDLIKNLITREILCEVFHTYINSDKIDIKLKKNKEIDFGGQIRKKAAENHTRNEKLVKMVHYLLTAPEEKRKKILVFACDILHARFLTLWLRTQYDISAEYIDSSLHESRNISRIQKFREKSEGHGKVLINTNMLTTGFDVPDIDCVIMGRPVISTVEYTQMIGRGMRGPRMGGTKEVWIVDFDDQVQLSEHMKNQTIPLGWKAMAYDDKNNLNWKSLSEKKDNDGKPLEIDVGISDDDSKTISVDESWNNKKSFSVKCELCEKLSEGILEITNDYELSDSDKNELTKFAESGINPRLSVLKNCSLCKKANEIFPDVVDPWRELITKEKSNPVLLEFVYYITSNYSGNIKIDITKILNVDALCAKILQLDSNTSEFKKLQNEIDTFDDNSILILKNKIQDVKNTITDYKLGEFLSNDLIFQININSNQKLMDLCSFYLQLNPLKNLIKRKNPIKEKLSLDEQLKYETKRIIFDVLGFIPEEDKFKETVGELLYEYMLKKYITYHNFQQHIPIAIYVSMLRKRSECLDHIILFYNKFKKIPSVVTLEHVIIDFKNTLKENFEDSQSFFKMMEQIENSIKNIQSLGYDGIKTDYEFVKSLTPYTPSTEEILRHSKIGIGQYIQYAGTISNFQNIYELPDDVIRLKLEQLKHDFNKIKDLSGSIPDEETIKKHTSYSEISEYLWFSSYEKFLEFVGVDLNLIKQSIQTKSGKESKNELISNAKRILKNGGMQELFEKLAKEPELKYILHFGNVEKFIEVVFSNNKSVALMRWNDIKKKYKNSL